MTWLPVFDRTIIRFLKKWNGPFERLALFVVFFWFGILKVLAVSPASALVSALFAKTIHFVSFGTFMTIFGVYEMLIGVLFLRPGLERLAIALLIPHLIATCLPLVLLPDTTWLGFLIPSMEGQYIIKNCIIVALAMSVGARLHPFKNK